MPEYIVERLYKESSIQDSKTVTGNGTVTPDTGFSAFKKVMVDVLASPVLQVKDITVTENGEQAVHADEGYDGLSTVNLKVNVTPVLEEVTVTPDTTTQTIEPSEGKDGISSVTVQPICTESLSVTGNGDYTPTEGSFFSHVNVNVPTPGAETEEKTVELSMASGNQVIEPTAGKVLSKVTVNKPDTLLPENIKNNINIGGVIGTLTGGGVDNFTLKDKFIVLTFGHQTGDMTITPTVNFTNLTNPYNDPDCGDYAAIMYADFDHTKSYNITLSNTWDTASFVNKVLVCGWGVNAGSAPRIVEPTSLNPLSLDGTGYTNHYTVIIIRGETPDD